MVCDLLAHPWCGCNQPQRRRLEGGGLWGERSRQGGLEIFACKVPCRGRSPRPRSLWFAICWLAIFAFSYLFWEEGIWGFCIFGMNGDNGGSVGVVESAERRERT